MRRFISISLLLLFTLPLVSPLFAAATVDANIPACCRRNGKHHCAMVAFAQSSSGDAAKVKTTNFQESCSYNFLSPAAINLPFVADKIQTTIFAGTLSQPASRPPTQALIRISFDDSHQKRGPPTLSLSRS